YPALSAMSPLFIKNGPPVGSPGWMRWFQNEKCGVPFDTQAKSADFSLQLAISMQNFDAGYTNLGGIYAEPAKPQATPAARQAPAAAMMMAPSDAARAAKEPPPPSHGQIIQPIVRDVLTPEPNE